MDGHDKAFYSILLVTVVAGFGLVLEALKKPKQVLHPQANPHLLCLMHKDLGRFGGIVIDKKRKSVYIHCDKK